MTDWLGMAASPRTPPPELKARALGRAFAARRRPWGWGVAAAAVLALALAGGALWARRTIGALAAERARLAARVAALEDTVTTFIHGPATRLVQIPVAVGGRVGSVTIFADAVRHRWLVRCDGLAPNPPDRAYQFWYLTDRGVEPAALMPMDQDQPMVMALELPAATRVRGVAMSIEPRAGSAAPQGTVLFRLVL
jgi:anti-sigma-K factor RskA